MRWIKANKAVLVADFLNVFLDDQQKIPPALRNSF